MNFHKTKEIKMNKNIKRLIILVAMLSLTILAAGSAIAGKGMGHRNMGQGCQQGMVNAANCPGFNNVNLTDEQKTGLEAEKTRFWNETSEIRTQLDQKETEMQTELQKPEVNREAVQNIQTQISNLEADFNKLKADHLIKVREISPEIAKQCANFGKCGRMGMAGCMGKGTGMGMGKEPMMNCPAATQSPNAPQN